MKIDQTTLSILKHLREGRKPFSAIAEELSIAENTVRTRVSKLEEEGILDITGVVDPMRLPEHNTAIVGVKLKTVELVRKGEEFSKLRGVISVSVVTGRFDLILMVLLKEGFGLLEFYTDEVSRIKEVGSIETFMVYKGFNIRAPYVL